MDGVKGKTHQRRFGISYLLLIAAVVTYLGVWGYTVLAADWKAKASLPQIDPVLTIIKGLRQYQKINATFPQTLIRLRPESGSMRGRRILAQTGIPSR